MLELKENKAKTINVLKIKQEAAVVELFVYPSTVRPATTGKTGKIQDQEAVEAVNIKAERQAVRKSNICPNFLHTCEKFVKWFFLFYICYIVSIC